MINYMDSKSVRLNGGRRKISKKYSRKATRKISHKGVKKTSRKHIRKISMKGSGKKKTSRKTTRKYKSKRSHKTIRNRRSQKGGNPFNPTTITDIQTAINNSKVPTDMLNIFKSDKTQEILRKQPGLDTLDLAPYIGLLNRIISNNIAPANADYSTVKNVLGIVNAMKKLTPQPPGNHPALNGLM
jgi:hypothetical protein